MGRPIRVLFGTETGNAEGCAEELLEGVQALGLTAELTDMDDYDRDEIAEEEYVFIVTSTFGNGDAPYNAEQFLDFLKGPDAPDVSSLRFAVCGLGDRSYPNFAQCGKDFDARLDALGGTRVVPRMDCDVDFEVPFDQWKRQVLGWLAENPPEAGDAPAPAARPEKKGGFWGKVSGWFGGKKAEDVVSAPTSPTSTPAPATSAPAEKPTWTRDNPFMSKVVARRLLSGEGSAKETMHYELDLTGSGIEFHGGDSFGVFPHNPPAEVAGILEGLGLDPEAAVTLKDGSTRALRSVLTRVKDLQRVPVDLLRALADAGGPGADALAAGGEATAAYLKERYVLDVVRDHPDAALDAQRLTDLLRALPPRLYSVANSPKIDADRVHFVVETLRYERQGRPCEGVASVWFADRVGDEPVPLYLQPNTAFRLPAPDVDIIMVGPGTGIAPFRAFLQERQVAGGSGRSWLFFGHQHQATDHLYSNELQAYAASGVLARQSYAWSRDQDDKIYVQDRIREEGAEVWKWLQGGAHVFVCGDAHGMAPGVHEALHQVAITHGGMDRDGAEAFVQGLVDDKRYHRDVY